jgi:hypothetical protein
MLKLTVIQFRRSEKLVGISLLGLSIWFLLGKMSSPIQNYESFDSLRWTELFFTLWFALLFVWGVLGVVRGLLKDYRAWPGRGETSMLGLASCSLPALIIFLFISSSSASLLFAVLVPIAFLSIAIIKNHKNGTADMALVSLNIALAVFSFLALYAYVWMLFLNF